MSHWTKVTRKDETHFTFHQKLLTRGWFIERLTRLISLVIRTLLDRIRAER